MRKFISVSLLLSMLFGLLVLPGSAAGGRSITLPFVYESKDDFAKLKYTVAVVCNGDHLPEPVDPDPADGKLPEKLPCTEHTTVIFCKNGETAENPDIDYVISYDMSKFAAPNEAGEIQNIDENFFEFSVKMDSKYVEKVTITANGAPITPNQVTGRYVLPMTYSYYLEIPTPDDDALYDNFTLRPTRVTFPGTGKKEGYNLYTFNFGKSKDQDKPDSNRPDLYERQNGRWGEDYYVKLLVQEGYRECLKGLNTNVPDYDESESILGIKLYASPVPNSPLPPLDSADPGKVDYVADIYIKRENDFTFYKYDFFNEEDKAKLDDSKEYDAEGDTGYVLCGRVYKIDGEVMKAESIDLTVQGVTADQVNNVFSWFFRIVRMIINLLKNFNVF